MSTNPATPARRRILGTLALLADLYLAGVASVMLLHAAVGDRWWWLFLAAALTPWLFLPLAVVAPLALALRRRTTLLGAIAALLLGGALLGGALLPSPRPALAATAPQLTVMSFNVFGFNPTPDAVVAAIRAADADLVALQELSPAVAAAIAHELAGDYPFMLLEPQPGVLGMGLLSRHPLRPLGTLPGAGWVGAPQVAALDLGGREVVALNVHAIPPMAHFAGSRAGAIRERELQAAAIVDLAQRHGGPLVAMGDLNAAPHHRAYQIIGAALGDAWAAQGGPGFTWPTASAGLAPLPFVRIDHIFHSGHLAPLGATVGPSGAGSDHLPVIATLALVS